MLYRIELIRNSVQRMKEKRQRDAEYISAEKEE